jgi:uncharacterized protein DUF5670
LKVPTGGSPAVAATQLQGEPAKLTQVKINSQTIDPMLTTIAIVLLALWLLGLVSSYTLGGFIHLLLVVAIVMLLIRMIQDKPAA